MKTYAEVCEFCVRKLAEILYQCVACSHANRAALDWRTAENFVQSNKPTLDAIHDCFQSSCGQTQDYEAFDKICGRAVWDGMYQPLQEILGLPYKPTPHYTHIRFS